ICAAILGLISPGLFRTEAVGSVPPPPDGGDVPKPKPAAVRPSQFDVGDVSFLIPPERCLIPLARKDAGGAIIGERLFGMLEDFIKRGHPGVDDLYHKMVITGFRFDPCGPEYPDNWDLNDPHCVLPNIRIIAQAKD